MNGRNVHGPRSPCLLASIKSPLSETSSVKSSAAEAEIFIRLAFDEDGFVRKMSGWRYRERLSLYTAS